MAGSYQYVTFSQARQMLARRLDDPSMIHWPDQELGFWIIEALRVFQCLTGYWRDRGTFSTNPGNAFYDLASTLRDSKNSLMVGYNVLDSDLTHSIEYHLLEPATIPWTGTDQFSLGVLTEALQRRRNQFLVETGAIISHSVIDVPPQPIGRVPLPDSIIDVRRIGWNPSTLMVGTVSLYGIGLYGVGLYSRSLASASLGSIPLWASDEHAATAFNTGWNLAPDVPISWSVIGPPPLQVQLQPPPIDKGNIDLLTVSTGTDLNPLAGVLMGIPDNYAWTIKFGALADLLSQDGQPRDDYRAGYCEQRFQEGCELARAMPVVVTAGINEVQTFVQSVSDLDAFRPSWCASQGTPDAIGTAGLNMIAVANIPDSGSYSIRLDVVRNAVVPVLDTDFVQVGREYLDAILDEAQHLAAFKMGGQEFGDTVPLHQRFIRMAANSNDRLRGTSIYLRAVQSQSTKETKLRPRRESDVEVTA